MEEARRSWIQVVKKKIIKADYNRDSAATILGAAAKSKRGLPSLVKKAK